MNDTTIHMKEILNYIWKKKIFLIIWIIAINSVFIIYLTIQPNSEFRAEVKYCFPQSEISTDGMSDVLDFFQRVETFKSNFQWLQKTIKNNSLKNQFIVKSKGDTFNMSISLSRTNSNNLEKDILNFANKIDSLFIEEKLSGILTKKKDTLNQIKNLNSGKLTFENTVITKKLNEILEKLVIEEYSIKNLAKEPIEKVIIENKTVSKNILFFGSLIFSIWSGLMIVIIKYFFR